MPSTQAAFAKRMFNVRGVSPYQDSFVCTCIGLASPQRGARVLDLACGTGLVTFLAAEHVGSTGCVVGVDISTGMLAQARERKESEGWKNVKFFEHDITDLGSLKYLRGKEGSFDVVVCLSALVLLLNPFAALQSWTRYLKPGERCLSMSLIRIAT